MLFKEAFIKPLLCLQPCGGYKGNAELGSVLKDPINFGWGKTQTSMLVKHAVYNQACEGSPLIPVIRIVIFFFTLLSC